MGIWTWPVLGLSDRGTALPDQVWTRAPFDADGVLDPLTALLLPSEGAGDSWLGPLRARSPREATRPCLGLWLGNPFSVTPVLEECLSAGRIGWISNFPATTGFGIHFAAQLSEVGLGAEREAGNLAVFRRKGYRILRTVVVGQEPPGRQAVDAVLVICRSALEAGPPSRDYIIALRESLGPDIPIMLYPGGEPYQPRRSENAPFDAMMFPPGRNGRSR